MKGKVRSIAETLNLADIAITNSINDAEILGLVSSKGYTKVKLQEGQSLLNSAYTIKDTHVANAGAQKQATSAAMSAKKSAIEAYQAYSSLAKGEFKGKREMLAKLGLNKQMPRTEAGFIAAGKTLFDNASGDPDMKEAMSKYGYDDATLAAEASKIQAYESANAAQKAAEGASQNSTDTQSAVMKSLQDWVSQYKKAARIALKDNKQLLEKLGIRVSSGRTKAQKKAPLKAAATRKAKKGSSNQ